MDVDQRLGQALIEGGHLPREVVRRAYLEAGRGAGRDLCDVLLERSMISPSLAEQIRREIRETDGGDRPVSGRFAVETVPDPAEAPIIRPSAPGLDSTRAAPAATDKTGEDEGDRAAVARSLHRLLVDDPLFAPHVNSVLKRGRVLGSGGAGVVYRVEDARLGRHAALKVLHPDRADGPRIARFLREARVTARLDHPSIPPVYEAGVTEDGEHYLLMKLIEGRTLGDHIKDLHSTDFTRSHEGTRSLRDLIEMLVRVSESVAFAHSQGIVHRDLKPENVMIGRFGEVLVMDWGLARDLEAAPGESEDDELLATEGLTLSQEERAQAGLTQTGALLGTLGYIPPEQAAGQPVDQQADVFALGAILFEILTGRPPVQESRAVDALVATITAEGFSPDEIRADIPPGLCAIARAALESDREQRTKRVELFLEDLKSWLVGDPISVYRPTGVEALQKHIERHPVMVLGVTMTALLLSLGATFVSRAWLAEERAELARREKELVEAGALRREREKKRFEELARTSVADKTKAEQEARRLRQSGEAFSAAEGAARRGLEPESLQVELDRALELGGRTPANLIRAARIHDLAGADDQARALLEEVIKSAPPAWEALFLLHGLESTDTDKPLEVATPALETLDRVARQSEVRNEFTRYARATMLLAAGKLERALAEFSSLIKDYEGLARAHFGRAVVRCRSGQDKAALTDLDQALRLDPRLLKARRLRAWKLREAGRFDAALADLDALVERELGAATIQRERGALLEQLGRVDEALVAYQAGVKDGEGIGALDRISVIHSRAGRVREALEAIDEAIRRVPDKVDLRVRRAALLVRCGEPHKARAELAELLRRDPDQPDVLDTLGLVYMRLRRDEDALSCFNKALEADPKRRSYRENRARILLRLGRCEEALEDYNRLAGDSPAAFAKRRAECALRLRRPAEVRRIAAAVRESGAAVPDGLLFFEGTSYLMEDKPEPALAIYQDILTRRPEHPETLKNAAICLESLARFSEGAELLKRRLAAGESTVTLKLNYGRLLLKAGRHSDVIAALEALAEQDPPVAGALLMRAQSRAELGQIVAARADLERARGLTLTAEQRSGAEALRARLAAKSGGVTRDLKDEPVESPEPGEPDATPPAPESPSPEEPR